MIELSILSTMVLSLVVAHIWPHIRLEKRQALCRVGYLEAYTGRYREGWHEAGPAGGKA